MHSRVKALLITAAILCACLLGCAAYAYGLQAEGWHCGSAEEGIDSADHRCHGNRDHPIPRRHDEPWRY